MRVEIRWRDWWVSQSPSPRSLSLAAAPLHSLWCYMAGSPVSCNMEHVLCCFSQGILSNQIWEWWEVSGPYSQAVQNIRILISGLFCPELLSSQVKSNSDWLGHLRPESWCDLSVQIKSWIKCKFNLSVGFLFVCFWFLTKLISPFEQMREMEYKISGLRNPPILNYDNPPTLT